MLNGPLTMLQLLHRLRHAKRKGIQKDASQSVKAYLNEIRQSGTENGKHYTDTPDEVKRLKREGHDEEAIALLLESVQMTEKESEYAGEGKFWFQSEEERRQSIASKEH
jgi:predicted HicB family RNase H-like nuclease